MSLVVRLGCHSALRTESNFPMHDHLLYFGFQRDGVDYEWRSVDGMFPTWFPMFEVPMLRELMDKFLHSALVANELELAKLLCEDSCAG